MAVFYLKYMVGRWPVHCSLLAHYGTVFFFQLPRLRFSRIMNAWFSPSLQAPTRLKSFGEQGRCTSPVTVTMSYSAETPALLPDKNWVAALKSRWHPVPHSLAIFEDRCWLKAEILEYTSWATLTPGTYLARTISVFSRDLICYPCG